MFSRWEWVLWSHFDLRKLMFGSDQNAQFSLTEIGNFLNDFVLCLRTRYAIFIHRDRQLSWRCLCFWTNDVIFLPRHASFQTILCLEQDAQFLSNGYFAYPVYPKNKQTNKTGIVPIDAARSPCLETIRSHKSAKFDLRKKSASIVHEWNVNIVTCFFFFFFPLSCDCFPLLYSELWVSCLLGTV